MEMRIEAKDYLGWSIFRESDLLRVFVIHSGGQPAVSHGRQQPALLEEKENNLSILEKH